jgi:glutamate synthase domain-containing protein 2
MVMTLLEGDSIWDSGWLSPWMIVLYAVLFLLLALAVRDRTRGKTGIIRNFPVVGHIRYFLIEIGPELRQYLVASNREEKPFNRNEREWIQHSANGENNFFGFGSDAEQHTTGYWIIKQSQFPYGEVSVADHGKTLTSHAIPCAKTIGEWHKRENPFRPGSIINVSAMSFGSLSGTAVFTLNSGAKLAGCYQNTGEGGCSIHHRNGGADIIYQIGTGMFGCRDDKGHFSPQKLVELLNKAPQIRCLEVKLSQGAKPGKGGVLPGAKVTAEIAEARGVNIGQDCISPNSHAEFSNVDEMIEFIEKLAKLSGRPVGVKSAVGKLEFWTELADKMAKDQTRGPDFITIDGGEGGTGAAPLTFTDHVSLPFKVGFPRVYKIFHERGIADKVVWIGSGKLGFPDRAMVAFAMGVDSINIARESMISIGCIQAQKCHTNFCPSGVATQSQYLQKAIVPQRDAQRLARYIESFRKELLAVAHASGYTHPSQITADDIEISTGPYRFSPLRDIIGYSPIRLVPGKETALMPSIEREVAGGTQRKSHTMRLSKGDMERSLAEAAAKRESGPRPPVA